MRGHPVDDRTISSIDISAPLERVWDLVTEPGWWVPSDPPPPVDRTPGRRVTRETEKWGRFIIETVRIEPRTYAAFRWASQFPGEAPEPGKATLVEFTVAPVDDAVRVTVTETGFSTLDAPEDVRRAGLADNTSGWQQELGSLRTRAEDTPAA